MDNKTTQAITETKIKEELSHIPTFISTQLVSKHPTEEKAQSSKTIFCEQRREAVL